MSKRQKTVLVFTAGDYKTASSKYRAFLLGKYLTEVRSDIQWKIVEPSTKQISTMKYTDQIRFALRHARELFWFPHHDVVFIQRALYNKFIFLALLIQNVLRIRPSIFDFDDAIFMHSSLKTRLLCKTSGAVIVGSHYLYDYASRYNTNVTLIPTCIKFSDYEKVERKRASEDIVTLGWLGSASVHLPALRFLAQVLRVLYDRGVQFRLLLIGSSSVPEVDKLFDFLPSDKKEVIGYVDAQTDATLVPYFSRMDIGLMPLEDTPWNRGKCSFKAIQYMASGAATVASPVGENSILIEHRKTGILATSKEEWATSLEELINNPALRRGLGSAAQREVREHYSYEAQCGVVGKVIDSVVLKTAGL